ncbi:MAG: carboxypeptidase-like regulatory domain-containing protein [Pirellulaceae bacterium]
MVTNQAGEAVFRWFPDWEDVHCYVDLKSDQWVIDGESKWVDGSFVVQVKPRALRRKVFGKLQRDEGSKAGYCVFWRSFEGEQDGHSDFINSVTDQHGNFSADVLPGATYCVFVNDTKDVSDMIDLIPAPTDDALAPTAVLHLQKPEMLAINVTAGKTKRPIANQPVSVRQTHNYQWMEDGKQDEQRSGQAARDQYVITDELGKATVAVESGKEVEVSIYNPDWRTTEELDVVAGQPNTVVLHRDVDQPRTIFGVVLQDENRPIPIDQIAIIAGSVDGETRGHEELELEDNGVFRMQTKAIAVGVLATTKDQSMAGVVVAENPHRIMRLYLHPTKQLRGRLVDSQGEPIVGCSVEAILRIKHEPEHRVLNAFYGYEANRQKVMTDADGYYTFGGLPTGIEIGLSAATAATRSQWLGTVKLLVDEDHAIETHTIDDDPVKK